jgi:hypothetical protein
MDDALLERLLYSSENEALDFKSKQYRFDGATHEEKSELLKDIIGFANSWKRTTAYILVGVEEAKGGRSRVVGIAPEDHLADHSLQQFVNSKTNKPVLFNYYAYVYEGKQIGVISITDQMRPIYLNQNYGKLLKEIVYRRLGSSTDITKPASPDEIAKMGMDSNRMQGKINVCFASVYEDSPLGDTVEVTYENLSISEHIPDYKPHAEYSPLVPMNLHNALQTINGMSINKSYYREAAEYLKQHKLYQPLRLEVSNLGENTANNVRIEIRVNMESGFCSVMRLKSYPESNLNMGLRALTTYQIPQTGSDGGIFIDEDFKQAIISTGFKILQAGRKMHSEIFYVGFTISGKQEFSGRIYADNLSKPIDFKLTVDASVKSGEIDLPLLKTLQSEKYQRDSKTRVKPKGF